MGFIIRTKTVLIRDPSRVLRLVKPRGPRNRERCGAPGGDITFAYLTDSATPLLDAVVDFRMPVGSQLVAVRDGVVQAVREGVVYEALP